MVRSIHRRTIIAMLVLIVLTTATLGGVAVVASNRMEDALLDTMIRRESEFLLEQLEREQVIELPRSSQTRAWYSRGRHGHVPEAFTDLPLGTTHEVTYEGQLFHTQRFAAGNGVLTIAVNITDMEAREDYFHNAMIGGGFAVMILALIAGLWLSRRVAAPITRLSSELETLPAEDLSHRFASQYQSAEIHVIAEALDQYMDKLRRMIERERSFAAATSHEIRSPLTVIQGALELASLDSHLSSATREKLARAQRSAHSLSLVMDGLFELAREPENKQYAAVDAGRVIADVITEFRRDRSSNQRIDWSPPVDALPLHVPESHLRMLARNLIDNALKHAPTGPIVVRITPEQLSVRDHGPGIDPEIMPYLFERSRRGIQSSGAGLGLYIAAELAERNGWILSAANEESGGSQFTVAFARKPASDETPLTDC